MHDLDIVHSTALIMSSHQTKTSSEGSDLPFASTLRKTIIILLIGFATPIIALLLIVHFISNESVPPPVRARCPRRPRISASHRWHRSRWHPVRRPRHKPPPPQAQAQTLRQRVAHLQPAQVRSHPMAVRQRVQLQPPTLAKNCTKAPA
ncbi:hypothetical protein [Thiomonas sp. FB-Cd]|uniref:hypothetical protein n=1 Tax=Thiomonas sp. FB-Cd TaxID=1158292 RepID=UPI001E38C02A|nr:hypothetical protein [Thiomonas sp. FB-Cd]